MTDSHPVAHIVSLLPPAVSEGWKHGRFGSAKERRCSDDTLQGKHGILPEYVHHVSYAGYVNVVDNEPPTGLDVRIKIVILQVRERVAMRSIQKDQVKVAVESESRERLLRAANHKLANALFQEIAIPHLVQRMCFRVFPGGHIAGKNNMPSGGMRQSESAFPAPCFSRIHRPVRTLKETVNDSEIERAVCMPVGRKRTNRFNNAWLGHEIPLANA